MFIGVARYELFIPASGSLKDKRQVLRPITSAVRNKLNVSIAEIDHQNLWQRAAFGVTCVAESTGQVRKVLQEVEKTIARASVDGAEIVGRSADVLSAEDFDL